MLKKQAIALLFEGLQACEGLKDLEEELDIDVLKLQEAIEKAGLVDKNELAHRSNFIVGSSDLILDWTKSIKP